MKNRQIATVVLGAATVLIIAIFVNSIIPSPRFLKTERSVVVAVGGGCLPAPDPCGEIGEWAAIDLALAEMNAQNIAFFLAVEAAHRAQMTATRGGGGGRCGDDWECFAACTRQHESDRNDAGGAGKYDQGYGAVDPSGKYRGAYQFGQSTWDGAADRAGYPQYSGVPPDQVPADVQDLVAKQLWLERGNQPWGGRC